MKNKKYDDLIKMQSKKGVIIIIDDPGFDISGCSPFFQKFFTRVKREIFNGSVRFNMPSGLLDK